MSSFECHDCQGTGIVSGDGCTYCGGTGIAHEEEAERSELSPSLKRLLERMAQQNALLGDLIKELREIPPEEGVLSQETFRVLGEIGKLLKDTPRLSVVCHEDDFEIVSAADPLAGTPFATEICKTTLLVTPGTVLFAEVDPRISGAYPSFDLRGEEA